MALDNSVAIVSAPTLERWDYNNPWTQGIGCSEGSAIEMAQRLSAKHKLLVTAYSPVESPSIDHYNVSWERSDDLDLGTLPDKVVINYRTPKLFDTAKPDGAKWWFVAQDVSYPWTPEQLAKVDRYITLCDRHTELTHIIHPDLKGRVYQSANGVRASWLNENYPLNRHIVRVPYRMLYASSPDRGLKFLLEQWWRIRERFPEATLHVAYGLNNMEVIAKAMGGNSWHVGFMDELKALLNQPGIKWLGRINANALYLEYAKAQIYAYPSDWPETFCCAIVDAMACGAIPVTTDFWAQGQWCKASDIAYVSDGLPQKSELLRSNWLNMLFKALDDTTKGRYDLAQCRYTPAQSEELIGDIVSGLTPRQQMMAWARESFDWDNAANQWHKWVQKDFYES